MATSPTRATQRAAVLTIASWDRSEVDIGMDPPWQVALSRSFAHDVLMTLLASPDVADVYVVSSDALVRSDLAGWDVTFIDDPEQGPAAALAAGRDRVVADGRHDHVVLIGRDLPSITVDALAHLCRKAAAVRHAYCPDVDDRYSSVILSSDPRTLPIKDGPRNAVALRAAGVVSIDDAARCARRGVRSRHHLFEVDRLGVGMHTLSTLLELGRSLARTGADNRAARMRATAS